MSLSHIKQMFWGTGTPESVPLKKHTRQVWAMIYLINFIEHNDDGTFPVKDHTPQVNDRAR